MGSWSYVALYTYFNHTSKCKCINLLASLFSARCQHILSDIQGHGDVSISPWWCSPECVLLCAEPWIAALRLPCSLLARHSRLLRRSLSSVDELVHQKGSDRNKEQWVRTCARHNFRQYEMDGLFAQTNILPWKVENHDFSKMWLFFCCQNSHQQRFWRSCRLV